MFKRYPAQDRHPGTHREAPGSAPFAHPDALGVRRFERSRFVTVTASGALSTTRVLRWEDGRAWSEDIVDLPRTRPRPAVYCPFCGQRGEYAHTDRHHYFRHADGEQDCVVGHLESVRHRRAKKVLLQGLQCARQEGWQVQWTLACAGCLHSQVRTVLRTGAWEGEAEERTMRPRPERVIRPDVVAERDGRPVAAFEVRQAHATEAPTLDAYEEMSLPMLEIGAHQLVDDEGRSTWSGREVLPTPLCWRVVGLPMPYRCEACAARHDPTRAREVLRKVARAARRTSLRLPQRCQRCGGIDATAVLPAVQREEMRNKGSSVIVFEPAGATGFEIRLTDADGEPEQPRGVVYSELALSMGLKELPILPWPVEAWGELPPRRTDGICARCREPSQVAQDIDRLWRHFQSHRPELLTVVRASIEEAAGLPKGALSSQVEGWASRMDRRPEDFADQPELARLAQRGLRDLHTGLGLLARAIDSPPEQLQDLAPTLVDLLAAPHRASAEALADGVQVDRRLLRLADELLEKLHLPGEDWRHAAWATEALLDHARSGHTCWTKVELGKRIYKRLKDVYQGVRFSASRRTEDWVDAAITLDLVQERPDGQLVLRVFAKAERVIQRVVDERQGGLDLHQRVVVSETTLHESQRLAVEMAMQARLSIITGAAGTGKTTVLRTLLATTADDYWMVLAPTGKAMNRAREGLCGLSNAAGFFTVARLLGQLERKEPVSDLPSFNSLVIDEASFLDLETTGRLFTMLEKAGRTPLRVVLVGDQNQLPSIQAGAVLHDLLSAENPQGGRRIPHTLLTQGFRSQARLSAFASSLLLGKPALDLVEVRDVEDDGLVMAVEDVLDALPADGRVQVLSPTRELVEKLNRHLRNRFNSRGKPIGEGLFNGDRVVCTRNRYMEPAILNGETGLLVAEAPDQGGPGRFWIEDLSDGTRRGPYPWDDRPLFQAAYALTVHKAQGSEWPIVLVVLPSKAYMVDRALLYTAATRARERLVFIGARATILRAAAKKRSRQTDLAKLLSKDATNPDLERRRAPPDGADRR